MDAISGIGFDLDHTLAIDNRLERVAFLRLLEVVVSEGGSARGTLGQEIEDIDELLLEQRRGDFSIDEAVRRFVEARGITAREPHAAWYRRTAVAMVDDFVVPLPGVERTLQELRRRGIAMAVLTNGWNPLQLHKAKRAGFDGPLVVSSEIGVQKPARAAFAALLRVLGTPPAASVYVGDDPRGDIEGAQAAGMQTVWIDWEEKQYPADLRPPERTIQEFKELAEILTEAAGTA